MAEAVLRHQAGEDLEVLSAGLESRGVHPLTLRVLQERGLPVEGLRSTRLDEVLGRVTIHDAIIVCEQAAERCPSIYPFALRVHTWPFPDPSAAGGDEAARLDAFRDVLEQIDQRVVLWWLREREHARVRNDDSVYF